MEAEILKEMIEDREQCITMIQRKSEEQSVKESRLRKELEEVQDKNTAQKFQLQSEKTTLLHTKQKSTEQLENVQRSLQEQGNSIKGYANAVQHDQKIDDSSYVMRMQAQLCKAMHSMGIMEHQVELARKHSQTITKIQKDALSQLTDEMSQMELQLMNTLMKYDTEMRDIEMELKSKVDVIQKDTDAVQRQIDENADSDEEDDSEEEESEEEDEEKEMKEELMQMLRDKKSEIDRFEAESEKQLETIEELEAELEDQKEQGGSSSIGKRPTTEESADNEQDEEDEGNDGDDDDDDSEGDGDKDDDGEDDPAAAVVADDKDEEDDDDDEKKNADDLGEPTTTTTGDDDDDNNNKEQEGGGSGGEENEAPVAGTNTEEEDEDPDNKQ